MRKQKLVSVLVAVALSTLAASAYSADQGTSAPEKATKRKSVQHHQPGTDVQGRSDHPNAPEAGAVKSHDPAASEVTGRSTHPDASGGAEVKSHAQGQQHDRRN